MKESLVGQLPVAAILASVMVWSCAAMEAAPENSPSSAPSGELKSNPGTPDATAAGEPDTQLNAATKAILKLLGAGVSTPVIRNYVESSPVSGPLSATDVIALKKKGIPDELVSLLLKRSAAIAPDASIGGNSPASSGTGANAQPAGSAPVYIMPNYQSGRMDPESYDFWWYHYAYPRSLAYANQRILSAYSGLNGLTPAYGYGYGGYGIYPYGYAYPPLPFWPYPFTTFSQPRSVEMNGQPMQ